MIEVAVICIGVGFLLNYSSHIKRMDADLLNRATRVTKLKGLEEFLEKKPLSRLVVVSGTVGSTSPLKSNLRGVLGCFAKETASILFKRKHPNGLFALEFKTKKVYREEVPWYLEDDTARVNVRDYQDAKGFFDVLDTYIFTEPVAKHFESLLSEKEVKIPADDENFCKSCEAVLKIGTPLTVVGSAQRDKDGAPMIGHVYQIFKGHVELNVLVPNLESNAAICGKVSLFLTAMGLVLLAVSILQSGPDIKE